MPEPHILQALLAGLLAGVAAALATTFVALVALSRDERWLTRAPNLRVPMPLVGVAFVNGLMLAWTLLGLTLGAALLRVEESRPAGGLGSHNVAFTAAVAGTVAIALVLAIIVRGRLTWPMAVTAAVAAASFGWMLPLLGV